MQPLVETRNKVNGKFLSDFSGKPITILGKVIKVSFNFHLILLQLDIPNYSAVSIFRFIQMVHCLK